MAFTTRGQYGWQYDKTVLECMRYMLDNEIATDVCFKVGPADGVTVSIRAHKYMLVSRSAVFEAMFSSGMSETKCEAEAVIRITDFEAGIFRELLRFIYCDSAEVTTTSVYFLMTAGKKYMLPKLVELCCGYLQKGLQTENVCSVLNESLVLEESTLVSRCLDLVVENSSEVLKPENLENASLQTMEAILKLDYLDEDETLIYNACINWAKSQLKNQKSIDHPNDQQIRETIGDLIYNIRFPTMEAKTFAKLVESSTLLSYEEQSSVLCYILNTHKRANMTFNCDKRISKEQFIDRGGSTITNDYWATGPDAIDVTTNRKIVVTGLGLLPGHEISKSGYTVDVEVLKTSISVFKMSTIVPYTGNSAPHKVAFQTPILMEPGILYTLVANSYPNVQIFKRTSCQPVCAEENVLFTFSVTSWRKNNSTGPTQGQIPRIYFRIPK